ncbi:hypothetical protein EC55P1_00012 [Enterococcus phage EC55P1]|nr:hypothetical protein EC55P1_00012 [Enterococcus phage EC55P1]
MDQPRLFIKDPQDNLITVISEGYFNVELTSYLTGAATTLSFSFVKDEDSYEQIVTGCKVAFIYKGKDYWMNIVRVSQDEDIMTVTAWGVSLELSNETVAPYKATKPMSFAEYANLWNYEKTFEIGINEVSDKKITHEWEGADKTLGRLLSLATVFDAEVEFVTYLDDFHNLDRIVMNVYKAHSETNQGLGLDSRQMVFRFGNEIETVSKEESAEELYTAITPTGKDGLNISSIEFEKFDADGNLEFCTYKTAKPNFPDVRKIYAPLAKLRHPSYRGQTRDEWTNFNWETEYTTANALSGNALSKLKTISAPVFSWDIVGVIDAGIGDTVTIEDDGYEPTLYLEARVSEQTIDFSDESKNKTTFTNVLEVGSAVDMSLLSRMEALIEANKTYVGSIQTTNGIVFKNNTGTTDLTAVVRLGTQTVTDNYDISWYKDGTEIANTATITVTAADVVEKALYKFEAKDADGVLVASYEVTVSDVSDGEEGRGISSTKVEYQASTSGTTVPTGVWLTNPPSVTGGQFLWTRTTFTYTDDTTTLSYSISRMGTTGTNGVGISDVAVTYQAGTSGTTPPTGTWTTTIPSVTANQYLWTRTVTTYTDSSTSTAYSVGKMGANGANAQLLYLSASANVMSFDSNDIVEPNQTVTITAKLQNATGTIVWTAIPYIGNAAQTPITLSGTGNSRTLTSGNWTNPNWTSVAVTATLGSLTDTISVVKVADGAAAHVHTAWSWSADGKDRFTTSYPSENILVNSKDYSSKWTFNYASLTEILEADGTPTKIIKLNYNPSGWVGVYQIYQNWLVQPKAGDTVTLSFYAKGDGRIYSTISGVTGAINVIATDEWKLYKLSGVATNDVGSVAIYLHNALATATSIYVHSVKFEKNGEPTPYTPAPSEDFANAYPTYAGTYTDYEPTDSEDPSKYTWQRILGESGQDGKDGIAGKDGVGVSNTNITYAQSTSGTTPPTTGWSAQVPTLVKGQYLWARTVWTYTDNSTETGYTVSYNAKDGNDGEDGIAGKDGVGISNTVIEYVGAVSGTSKPTSGWSTTIPTVPAGQYLWTRTTWQYTDGTSEQGFTNALMGRTGASGKDGVAGKDGVGIKSTQIMYAQSTSGTTAPSTGWTEQVPTLIKGQYLWTQTTWVYTDNTGEAGYTVSYNAKDGNDGTDGIAGKDGVGISSTVIEYVASASGTVKPTTGWSTTIPTVAQGQYLWTRTTWKYTDSTSEQGYSVARQGANGTNGTNGTDGADGKDAQEVFSGYLTNESIVLPANAAGTVTDFSKANGTFVTFLGQNQLSTGVAYSLESATGITTTINATSGAYSVTAISADVGVAIYKAVYSGITIRKQVMVVKAAQGASGVGLTTTTITYQVGTSGTTAPTGTWSTNVPTVPAGQFLWTRTVWAFSDGTSKTGYSISKAGETGATGNGIASSAITYASSTSGTTVPTSGWQATIPTVASGSFLWTRTIFTYTNGNTNTSYAVAKQGEKGDPTGILSQNTVPTAAQRYVGMLWKNTGASGYINGATYRWNGSAFELYIFTAENMSVSNLAAISANLGTITAGTINGVTINGSEFINPYTRSYDGGTVAQGTQRIGSAELYNSGVIKNSQGVTTQSYETIFSHQFVSMARYSGTAAGDQNKLIASMGLTFDSLTLNNQQTGFAGTLTAEMLYDTGWLKVTRLKGTAGEIYLKRYMNRILIRFDQFVWNGSANGASTSNAVAILPDKVREGFPQMFTVPVWVEGNATEKFQVENGRLYKLSNSSGNSRITAVGEVYI